MEGLFIDKLGIDDFLELTTDQHEAAIAIYGSRIEAAVAAGDQRELTKLYGLRRLHLERLADLSTDDLVVMPKRSINFYTSAAAVQLHKPFTDVLGENLDCEVKLRPLADLPKPDLSRKQRLRTELADKRDLLSVVLGLIQIGESDPVRFADDLVQMRRDRDVYEFRIAEIEKVLGEERGNG